jgi:hypothetical protein
MVGQRGGRGNCDQPPVCLLKIPVRHDSSEYVFVVEEEIRGTSERLGRPCSMDKFKSRGTKYSGPIRDSAKATGNPFALASDLHVNYCIAHIKHGATSTATSDDNHTWHGCFCVHCLFRCISRCSKNQYLTIRGAKESLRVIQTDA